LVITGLCFCASGNTSGPFWPHPGSSPNAQIKPNTAILRIL
jgi:hypothetical protein